MMQQIGVLFLGFSLFAVSCLRGAAHPADANSDQRITTAEIQSYWANGFGVMSADEKRAEEEWQQAEFLWRNGERYRDEASLADPFGWLPLAGNWVSLSNRYARGLEVIELFATVSPSVLTGEFRIPGSVEWVDLDCRIESDGRLRMMVPYVPSQWLGDSRRITVRFQLDGVSYQGGEILLREIDRSGFNFETFYDQTIKSIDLMAGTQGMRLGTPVYALRQGQPVSDPLLHHFATARFAAEFSRDVILTLRDSGSSGAAVFEMNEELLNLIIPEDGKAEMERMAAGRSASGSTSRSIPPSGGKGPKDAPSLFFGCAPINDAIDLALESQERCRLENQKSIVDQLKEFTGVDEVEQAFDKLGEKVSELGEKTAKKFVSEADAGSKVTSGLPAFAIKTSYELYQYREAWQKEQLPKFIEKFNYEVADEEIRARGYLYEDARMGTTECETVTLKVFAHVRAQGFDTAKYLRDKIPTASDAIPPNVSGIPLLGGVITDLVDSGQKAALDIAEAGLRDDLRIEPCRWPLDGSAKGIELRPEEQFRLTTVAGSAIEKTGSREELPFFRAARVGKGPLRVSLLPGESGNDVCLEPYTGFFSFEVKPIVVKFNPTGYTVDDVDELLTLQVFIEDSYDTDKLEWDFRDKNGSYLGDLLEDNGAVTLSLPHITTSGSEIHTLTINPPDDQDLYPLTVEAVSLAEGCLRNASAPDRRGTAKIHYQAKAFEIKPNRKCLSLNSNTVLTAIPADPSNTLDVEWEIVSGDATIVRTSPTTAVLTAGDTPEAEIEIKAIGNDTFETFAYFSIGPCFEEISLTTLFPPELISSPQVGMAYDNGKIPSVLSFGKIGGLQSMVEVPLLVESSAANYNPGIEQVYGIGAVRATVTKVEAINLAKKLVAVEAGYQGMFFTIFNLNRPGVAEPIYNETLGGTYFDDYEFEEDETFDSPLVPVKMVWTADGFSIDATFEKDVANPGTGGGGLSATWTVFNGTKVEEYVEDDVATLVARFSVFELSPTVQVLVSGTVVTGDETKSYSVQGLTQHRAIYLVGETRFKAIQEEDQPLLCGGWIGTPDPIGFILDDCCGFINLSASSEPEYLGVGRQNVTTTGLTDVDEGIHSVIGFVFNTDTSLPYCKEVRRLKTKTPNPDPYDEPEDPVDPGPDDTPEELEGAFKGSPNPGEDTKFPPADAPAILAGGGSSAALGTTGTTFRYPFTNLLNPVGIQLGTFDRATGARLSTETVVSQDALNYFGGLVRMAGVVRFSATTGSGYLIERNDPDTNERFFDFWELDPVDGLLIARTLATDPTTDFSLYGSGDFDGDGTIDLVGGSESNLLGGMKIRKGSGAGFAAAVPFYANTAGDVLRSAAVVPSTGQSFVAAMDENTSALKIRRLSSAGALVSTHVISGLDGNTHGLKAFTDADGDSIPDIVLHNFTLTNFTVIYLNTNGTERARKNFEVPMFSTLPGAQF